MSQSRRTARWCLAFGMVWSMLSGHTAFAGIDAWTLLGPTSLSSDQTIRAIAVNPTDSLIIYAGNDTATVYKTINGGTSWSALTVDPTRRNLHLTGLAIVPTSPDSIFAATDSGTVYRSITAGVAWTRLTTGFVDSVTNSLVMNPDVHQILYTGTRRGIYKTTDFGANWFPVNNGLGADTSNIRTVSIDEDNPNIIYAGTSGGKIYRSDNSGGLWTTWTTIGAAVNDIAIDPSEPTNVYVATSDSGVYVSSNRGVSFTKRNSGLTVPPLNLSLSVLSLAIDTSGTVTKVYAGTQNNGVFLYNPTTTSWRAINTGLTNGTVRSLAVNPNKTTDVYAGTQAQGIHVYTGNREPILSTIGNKSVNARQTLTFTVIANDPDGNAETQALSYGVNRLPLGATYDSLATRVFSWTPADSQAGLDTLLFRVRDARGGVDSETVVISVNQNPIFTPIADRSANENANLTFTLSAVDADGDSVTYSASTRLPDGTTQTLPSGATLNSTTGAFAWTPPFSTVSRSQGTQVYTFTFTASDTADGAGYDTVTVTVVDVNQPPVFTGLPALVSVNEGQALEVQVQATDGDGDPISFGVVGTLPGSAGFDSVGTKRFSWIPSFADSGSYNIAFKATDGRGGTGRDTMQVRVRNLNQLPQLAVIADTFHVDFGDSLYVQVNATDGDNDSLLYNAAGLPAGATFNTVGNRRLRWVPNIDQHGIFNITVNVEDQHGGSDFHRLTVVVNSAPGFVTYPGSFEVTEGDTVRFSLKASDNDGDALTYSVIDAPTGATITTTDSIRFVWITGVNDQGTYAPTFRVIDGKTGVAERQVQIKVLNVNRPPVFTTIIDQVVQPGGSIAFNVTATDPDNQAVTMAAFSLPAGSSFNTTSRVFTWQTTSGQTGADTVLFVATDPDGASDSMFVKITISNVNVAPVITSIADKTVGEGVLLNFAVVAADGNGDTLSYAIIGTLPSGAVFDTGAQPAPIFRWTPGFGLSGSMVTVQFSVSDGRGGAATQSVKIYVSNINRLPSLGTTDTTITENQALALPLRATDLDSDLLSVSVSGLPTGALVDSSGTFRVLWTPNFLQAGSYPLSVTVRDTAGGQASKTITVTVTNQNRIPGNIIQIYPVKGEEATLSDYLIWTRSVDPDADDVISYEVVFDNNAAFTSPELVIQNITVTPFTGKTVAAAQFFGVRAVLMEQLIQDAQNNGIETVAIQLATLSGIETLADDAVYFWRIRAKDNRGAVSAYTAGGSSLFFNSNNSSPKPVTEGLTPGGGVIQTQSPQISWNPTDDPDLSDKPETLTYQIQLHDAEDFTGEVRQSLTTEQGTNVITIAAQLADNQQWFYRIRAIDDDGATSPWSSVQSFYVNTQNDPPDQFNLLFPLSGALLKPMPEAVTFRWEPTVDPDPLSSFTYTLELATSETFDETAIVHRQAEIAAAVTELNVATGTLQDGTYYWRVISVDNEGLARPCGQSWSVNLGKVTGIDEAGQDAGIPETFVLGQNFPNPFNPTTTIRYGLPATAHVQISIFNILGQLVETMDFGEQTAGWHRITWDGKNRNGIASGSGVYIYRLKAGSFVESRTMMLMK